MTRKVFLFLLCISKNWVFSCLCNQKNLLTSSRNRVRTNSKTLFIAVTNLGTDGSSSRHNGEKKICWCETLLTECKRGNMSVIHAVRRSFSEHTCMHISQSVTTVWTFLFACHLLPGWNNQGFTLLIKWDLWCLYELTLNYYHCPLRSLPCIKCWVSIFNGSSVCTVEKYWSPIMPMWTVKYCGSHYVVIMKVTLILL